MKLPNSFWLVQIIFILCVWHVAVGRRTTTEALTPEESAEQIFRECQYDLSHLSDLILGLDNALDFYHEHLTDLVLDAATGTRILEAQLNIVLNQSSTFVNIPKSLRKALNLLYAKSQVISEHIIINVMENPDISSAFKNNTLPWVISSDLWQTPTSGNWNNKIFTQFATDKRKSKFAESLEILNETLSDSCIGDLFRKCGLSTSCAQSFLHKPHSKYSLTHQIIFAHVAEKISCLSKSSFKSKFESVAGEPASWEEFKSNLCDKVWVEANIIAEQNFPTRFQDLFAEQIAICSLAGYKNFLRPEWLQKLLSWQIDDDASESNGCFGLRQSNPVHIGRQKREDVLLETGIKNEECSVHFTAVGISAMGMYLRIFLESCLAEA